MNAASESYIIEQASLRGRLLSVTAGFPRDEIEDARQDLLLDFLRRAPKFDSTRGDWDGFVRGLMRHRATVLIARRQRRVRREILAGDLLEPGCDGSGDPLDSIVGEDPASGFNISLDVQRVLGYLPAQLQVLAYLLPDLPIGEICAATGKSRSRLYQLIRQLRVAFTEAGLCQSSGHSAAC